jgi:hypothetical protein
MKSPSAESPEFALEPDAGISDGIVFFNVVMKPNISESGPGADKWILENINTIIPDKTMGQRMRVNEYSKSGDQ